LQPDSQVAMRHPLPTVAWQNKINATKCPFLLETKRNGNRPYGSPGRRIETAMLIFSAVVFISCHCPDNL
jgi:hypothetical protein